MTETIIKEHGLRFMQERYWEDRFLAKPQWWIGRKSMRRCVHRSGVVSKTHAFDKDGRCIFCDWLKPQR